MKVKDILERRVLEHFVGHPITDTQWELFKKVSDAIKKCPPDCEVKWGLATSRQGITFYRPEYVKKGEE